jgi:hypothetical protein
MSAVCSKSIVLNGGIGNRSKDIRSTALLHTMEQNALHFVSQAVFQIAFSGREVTSEHKG